MSHTHSAAYTSSLLVDRPGAELIVPYLEKLTADIGDAVVEARSALQPAFVSWGGGRCSLAANRVSGFRSSSTSTSRRV